MHIPPYYKMRDWQRFLAGTFVGAIISYVVFIYMYGQFYENWVEENLAIRSELNELEENYQALQENGNSKENITVNSIEISITNQKQLKLDSLSVHQLQELIKTQIRDVIGKDIESLSKNYTFITSTVENKQYTIDEFTYKATVKQLFIPGSTLTMNVELSISN
ncbi:sporulation membrane protein YtrI [Aquibacillus salsiterrae]|uniref:Sporulation membrane protein YtrI C-terminal domain-containing protein n=1 Tax=Aquibacillus salsiterrae TaxID=2950439 RepID=A0A9X3WEU4_9BACI|nr:sporulation membrane protein YtrI [Aquibacillus salsiterrae]MDC3415756.1 hypothetical protein [Aquibacillus salsiterrae]